MSAHADYLTNIINKKNVSTIKRQFKAFIKQNPHIKGIVGTGLSGSMIIPILAFDNDLEFCIIRKETDNNHSGRNCEFSLESWCDFSGDFVFVDDLIFTGATTNKVIEHIKMFGFKVSNIFCYEPFWKTPMIFQGVPVTTVKWKQVD